MPKVVKIFLISLAGLLLLLIGAWMMLQTAWLQKILADKATRYLSKELNTVVSIGKVKVDFFDELSAEHIYIQDLYGDTLIYVEKLKVNFNVYKFTKNNFVFDKAELLSPVVNIGTNKGAKELNIQFFIDFFSAESADSSGQSPTIVFSKLKLNQGRFSYFDREVATPSSRDFHENNIEISDINGAFVKFEIINDSLHFGAKKLSAKERSGFELIKLAGDIAISPTTMDFNDFVLETPRSTMGNKMKFSYSDYKTLSDFIDSVHIAATLSDTKVHSRDLAYFSNELKIYDELVYLSGDFKGWVSDFKLKNTQIDIPEKLSFDGNAHIKGLPDVYQSFADFDIQSLNVNLKNISQIPGVTIPKELLNVEYVDFSGTFIGYYDEFDIKGGLTSLPGDLELDLLYNSRSVSIPTYVGNVFSTGFDFGIVAPSFSLGKASFNISLDGEGTEVETLNTKVEGQITELEYNKTLYQNIALDGELRQKLFNGFASIDDPNLAADLKGTIDFSTPYPKTHILTHIQKLNLRDFGVDTIDNVISLTGKIDFEGNDINRIIGEILLDSISLKRNGEVIELKEISIKSDVVDNMPTYHLVSELGNATLKGTHLITEYEDVINYTKHLLLPDRYPLLGKKMLGEQVSVELSVAKRHALWNSILPMLKFNDGYVKANLNTRDTALDLSLKGSDLVINNLFFGDYQLTANKNTDDQRIAFALATEYLSLGDTIISEDLKANGTFLNQKIDFDFSTRKDSVIDIALGAELEFLKDSITLNIKNSELNIKNEQWILKPFEGKNVVYSNNYLELFYFDFRKGNEILFFDGAFGNGQDKINLALSNFKIENILPFIPSFTTDIKGVANGFVELSYRSENPIFESDLVLDNLSIEGDTLGRFILKSETGTHPLEVLIKGGLVNPSKDFINIGGKLDFRNKNEVVQLKISAENTDLHYFEKYFEGLATDVVGRASVDIVISGTLENPQLSGQVALDNVLFTVDYLQTTYSADVVIDVSKNLFVLRPTVIYDVGMHTAKMSGSISHQNFKNFKLDIRLDNLENFQCLNTSRKDNELFYGSAFADGNMKISGPLDNIFLQINARSKKGTKINIPLDNVESDGLRNYIQFVNLKDDNYAVKKVVNSSSGVSMDFNFEVTKDAEVQLIFDELLGDVIKGRALGNLRMEINSFGEFNMYGGLTISEGEYLFTAFNVLNKFFTVTPGGTISWDGNPYNAVLNLEAVKRENPRPSALMAGLVSEAELENYKAPIPVDCILYLKGALFNPEVSFDLSFPSFNSSLGGNNTSAFNAVIQRIKSEKEELNRQVFSLLALGSFIPPSFSTDNSFSVGTGLQSSVNNSVGDFISSQVSNWLSQIDPKWQVGLNYQGGTEAAGSELVLSLRRKFINERLEFSGSYDAINSAGTRPYDFNLQYNLTADGSFRVKGFQRNANDLSLGNLANITTSGLGFFYRYQFDKFNWFRKEKTILSPQKDSLPNTN